MSDDTVFNSTQDEEYSQFKISNLFYSNLIFWIKPILFETFTRCLENNREDEYISEKSGDQVEKEWNQGEKISNSNIDSYSIITDRSIIWMIEN